MHEAVKESVISMGRIIINSSTLALIVTILMALTSFCIKEMDAIAELRTQGAVHETLIADLAKVVIGEKLDIDEIKKDIKILLLRK